MRLSPWGETHPEAWMVLYIERWLKAPAVRGEEQVARKKGTPQGGLDYTITCNHIHLIVYDSGDPDIIERSLQLTQGRLAQEYNRRKGRLGAFWQDRYHATAIQSGTHLRRCMTYVDMNMVRAGVVAHPADWPSAGYHEIQRPPKRYRLLNLDKMMELIGATSHQELARWQEDRVREAIANHHQR